MSGPRLTMPSHGGVANPDWQFKRGADLRETFARVRRQQRKTQREQQPAQPAAQDEAQVLPLMVWPRHGSPR